MSTENRDLIRHGTMPRFNVITEEEAAEKAPAPRRIVIMYRVPVAVTVNLDGDPEAEAYTEDAAIEDVQVWDTATELNESYFGSRYGMDPDTGAIIRNREMFDKAVELAEEAEWPVWRYD